MEKEPKIPAYAKASASAGASAGKSAGKKKSKWLIPAIVVVGIIFLGLGTWAGYNHWNKLKNSQQPLQEQPKDEFVGWQTYRNEEYGFEFKYPQNYSVDFAEKGNVFSIGKGIILETEKAFNFEEDKSRYKIINKEEIKSNNYDGIEYFIEVIDPRARGELYLVYGGGVYTVIELSDANNRTFTFIINSDAEKTIADQIFSTFKFFEPIIDTSDWEIYRNQKYGYEFKYPQNIELVEEGLISDPANEKSRGIVATEYDYEVFIIDVSDLSEEESKLTLDALINKTKEGFDKKEYLTVNGEEVIKLIFGKVDGDMFFFAKNNDTLIIFWLRYAENEVIFNHILSTFKFIEPKQGFCGRSTNGPCSVDNDCMSGGCSGQVCQSKSEEPIVTTCEYKDCYNPRPYGLTCGCENNKCQWK